METEQLYNQGVTIMLMVGGAGGAYTELFRDFKDIVLIETIIISKNMYRWGRYRRRRIC